MVFINAAITSWITGQDNLQPQVTSKHFILLLVGPVSDFRWFFERGTHYWSYWKNQSWDNSLWKPKCCPTVRVLRMKTNMVFWKRISLNWTWSMQMAYLAVINRRALAINNLKQCFRKKSQPWAHRNLSMIVIIKKTNSRADKMLHNLLSPQRK